MALPTESDRNVVHSLSNGDESLWILLKDLGGSLSLTLDVAVCIADVLGSSVICGALSSSIECVALLTVLDRNVVRIVQPKETKYY